MFSPLVCKLYWAAQKYIYQTTIVVSTQANMQGLQRPKILDNIETRFHVIYLWWLSSKDATKEGTFSLYE